MYSGYQDPDMESMRKRLPPAIPRRNPETRLSTSSDSAHSQEQQDDLENFHSYRDYHEDGQDSGHITPDLNDLDLHSLPDPFNGHYAKSSVQAHVSQYGGNHVGNGTVHSGYGHNPGHRGSTSTIASIPGYAAPPAPHRQTSLEEETFHRQLPLRMSSQQPYYQQDYGAQMPNGYGSDRDLYNTTLPNPYPTSQVAPPAPAPQACPLPLMARQLAASQHHNTPSPPPPPPPLTHAASPDTDFPPPPPPLFADPQSPSRRAPATMPKPQAKKSSPSNTMPKKKLSAGSLTGLTTERGFDIDPELAAKLNTVRINIAEKQRSSDDERPSIAGGLQSHVHSELISEIQTGIQLRSSPLGDRIRDHTGDDISTADAQSEESFPDPDNDVETPKIPPPVKRKPENMPAGGSESTASSHEYQIDPRTLEGYIEIPDNCPTWKRAMYEKKNKQIEDEARRQWMAVKAEEEKWKGVPEWKKKMIQDKQRKRSDEECEEEEKRKEEMAKINKLPEWKQEIMRKKMGYL